VQKILETRLPRSLLADRFADQTAAVIEDLATRVDARMAERPADTPVESESEEAA
jgi:hypothetical protein